MKLLKGCLILCLTLFGLSGHALEGWSISNDNVLRIYKPNNLPEGRVYANLASGPYPLQASALKPWLTKISQNIQRNLGEPQREWIFKSAEDSWAATNVFVDKNTGEKLVVAYLGAMLDRNKAYVIVTISSMDIEMMKEYGKAFNLIRADAINTFNDKPTLTSSSFDSSDKAKEKPRKKRPKNSAREISKAVRAAPGKGLDLSGIELIWVYSDIDLIWGGIDVDTYLLLKDGTVYKDCVIPPDELNVAASKKLEPEKWSKWRKNWGTYQIKNKKNDEWVKLKGGPGRKAPEGTELSGRYMTGGGSEFRGSWKNHINFLEDGRFEMSSFSINSNSAFGGGERTFPLVTAMSHSDKHGTSGSSAVVGGHVGGGASSVEKDGSKNTGTYEVSDYTITLKHDNGWNHTELFLYEDHKDDKSIVYGNELYILDE